MYDGYRLEYRSKAQLRAVSSQNSSRKCAAFLEEPERFEEPPHTCQGVDVPKVVIDVAREVQHTRARELHAEEVAARGGVKDNEQADHDRQ